MRRKAPYFWQQPAQVGNPGSSMQAPHSASPGWTNQDYTSKNDHWEPRSRRPELHGDPFDNHEDVIYEPEVLGTGQQNLSYGPKKRKITPDKAEDQGGGGFWPWTTRKKDENRKNERKPRPYQYMNYPLFFLQQIDDHPDFRDTNRVHSPQEFDKLITVSSRGGRIAMMKALATEGLPGADPALDYKMTRAQVARLAPQAAKNMQALGITSVSRDVFLWRLGQNERKSYYDVLVQYPPYVDDPTNPAAEKSETIVSEAKSAASGEGYTLLDADLVPDRFKEDRIFTIAVEGEEYRAGDCEAAINAALKSKGSPSSVRIFPIPRKPFLNLPFFRPVLDPTRPGAVDEDGKPVDLAVRDEEGRGEERGEEQEPTSEGVEDTGERETKQDKAVEAKQPAKKFEPLDLRNPAGLQQ